MLKNIWIIAPATMAIFSSGAGAQTLAEDFTKATITNDWAVLGAACLTAANATNNSQVAPATDPTFSTIPACPGPVGDAIGAGALRLTKATNDMKGAIIWNDTFPTNKGLQVTFTTYTYGSTTASGSGTGGGFQGADGMSFFLMDGNVAPNLGSWGGSLGYSCSNGNGAGNGVEGAYLGLGIDEYGNFLNSADNTKTGIAVASVSTSPNGYNNFTGSNGQYQANRIGLRGAGNVNWKTLNALYPTQYATSYTQAKKDDLVKATCKSGLVQEYKSNGSIGAKTPNITLLDYQAIPGGYWVLPGSKLISKVGASTTRAQATPITYRLMITPAGLLNFQYSYNGAAFQQVLSNWPITADNGPLPATFRFGFAAATGSANNVHEISCFVAEPTESTSSAGANTVQAGQVRTGTQVYLASFNPNNWAGSLVSADLVNTGGVVSISNNYNWDLNCKLTGGGCASMGVTNGMPTNTIAVQTPATRKLLTHNGTAGIPLQWGSLTDPQKAILNASDSGGEDRLNWLRGVRTKEQTASPAGPLRARGGVLGDIVDSSPTWVGPPSMGYGATITDALYGAGSETSYTTFATNMRMRQHVVYAGSNDGFLHGARAGTNDGTTGNYVGTENDGAEVIAFMPPGVLADAKVVSLTTPTYGHEYFVDAAPGTGDVFYGNAWHTWLVGGVGPGGKEIYALDVTDPTGTTYSALGFSEANAASIVKGAWTSSTLSNLGYTFGTPLVRRMHNGQWAIIFGNGTDSASYLGGIYIGLLDKTSGAVTFKWISTGVGSASSKNGITNVASGDLDGDRVADFLYAGDLLGNVWRFDVTSSNALDWGVSKYGQGDAVPLFSAKDSGGTAQPITTKIAVASVLTGGSRRVVLGFGTGKSVPFTNTVATSYAGGAQTVYGIWDWDMGDWNGGRTTANSVVIPASTSDFASLTKLGSPYRTFNRSNLDPTVLASSSTATRRELAINKVCWLGSTACPSDNNQYGWRFDLPTGGEQLIYNPVFTDGVLVMNTAIPPATTVGQCTPALPTGWTMAFKMDGGGGDKQNLFPDPAGSLVVSAGHQSIVGIKDNAVGTPYVVTVGSNRYIVNQTIGGKPKVNRINPQGGVNVKRISLEQLR
jgi:type IV pilus assembly protein PilY1